MKKEKIELHTTIRHFHADLDLPNVLSNIIIDIPLQEIPEIAFSMCKKPVKITIEGL